jgi:hypothetical protein
MLKVLVLRSVSSEPPNIHAATFDAMAAPAAPPEQTTAMKQRRDRIRVSKKKGCKRSKCSNWKGGCCRCGRS